MINAYAALQPGGPLQPFSYDPGPLGDDEVEIQVDYCGICHSDLSMLNNEWGITQYPFVPGHEVAGRIGTVGKRVRKFKPGDRVGLGWHAGYCLACPSCLGGDHNLCEQATGTIVGHHGGFADKVRAQATSVVALPDSLLSERAGPLFCAGVTVFNPLIQFAIPPTASVGVIGIGGLGHMALAFLRAWGCQVTAFTSSPAKREEALLLGAHRTIDSRDPQALKQAAGQFDLLLCTVNVTLDWAGYLSTLKPKGRLHFVGALLEPLPLSIPLLMGKQRSVSASPVGSPAVISQMLRFAARHDIAPVIEVFDMAEVNQAIAHLEAGKARYRVVLKRSG